ncbi:MAG TPA: hypothetical protein PKJ97_01885, partial [Candidatus Bilamarchaeaceae archaeon]|nr:hypothetical protein [Candidatus Bilamarchaeaceae archaeon]
MFQNMLNALIPAKLAEMCKREKGDVMEGIKYLVVGGVISLVLTMVQMVLVGLISGRMLLEVAGMIALVIGW